ncbi:MAG: sulfurtransferase TusA family protein [Actinomycetota bacterium]|nr:sulfurtransferase TusA family protein [Actinomycetota bacterium]
MTTLDARGLACPLPLTLARRRMAELRPGETLLVLATDPEAPIDLAAWATDEGHSFRDLSERLGRADERAGRPGEPPSGAPERAPYAGWLTLELRKAR